MMSLYHAQIYESGVVQLIAKWGVGGGLYVKCMQTIFGIYDACLEGFY